MISIALDPAEVVIVRTIQGGHRWFEQTGRMLSEDNDDPIALVVPSVIVPEYNVVLYPRSSNFESEFGRIESVQPFEFDSRLFERIPAS